MNQLDETIAWYRIVQANQVLSARFLRDHPDTVPGSSPFFGKSIAEAAQMLEKSAAEIDDLTVVALVSFFEQLVLDYVRELAEQIEAAQSAPAMGTLVGQAFEGVERWPFTSILKLFETTVDKSLLNQVTNIYKYRNWVAHGKRKQKPVTTDPVKTYEALSRFLGEIGKVVRLS